MTNKRQLKKYFRYVCGDLAAEIIVARDLFGGFDDEAVSKLIIEIADLQQGSLSRVNFSFDKSPKDFATKAEYNKALKAYHHTAYDKLLVEFDNSVEAIVKKMNEITPQEVRDAFKDPAK